MVVLKSHHLLRRFIFQYILFYTNLQVSLLRPFKISKIREDHNTNDQAVDMAPRRTGTQDSLSPNAPPSPAVSRSTSPSSGFTQFLSKPSKWFTRSVSGSKAPAGTIEARPSMSSAGGRKHKISRPTDPRPIMDGYTGGASK